MGFLDWASIGFHHSFGGHYHCLAPRESRRSGTFAHSVGNGDSADGTFTLDRKSTRLNSSHTEIYTLSLHDALPISFGGHYHCLAPRESRRSGTFAHSVGNGDSADGTFT